MRAYEVMKNMNYREMENLNNLKFEQIVDAVCKDFGVSNYVGKKVAKYIQNNERFEMVTTFHRGTDVKKTKTVYDIMEVYAYIKRQRKLKGYWSTKVYSYEGDKLLYVF